MRAGRRACYHSLCIGTLKKTREGKNRLIFLFAALIFGITSVDQRAAAESLGNEGKYVNLSKRRLPSVPRKRNNAKFLIVYRLYGTVVDVFATRAAKVVFIALG